jgi:hypothetical protein
LTRDELSPFGDAHAGDAIIVDIEGLVNAWGRDQHPEFCCTEYQVNPEQKIKADGYRVHSRLKRLD